MNTVNQLSVSSVVCDLHFYLICSHWPSGYQVWYVITGNYLCVGFIPTSDNTMGLSQNVLGCIRGYIYIYIYIYKSPTLNICTLFVLVLHIVQLFNNTSVYSLHMMLEN